MEPDRLPVEGGTRASARKRIIAAARRYDIEISDDDQVVNPAR